MIKLCVFDLDGTLINSLEDLAFATNYALNNSGFPSHKTEEYKRFVGDGVFKLIERAVQQKDCSPEVLAKIKSDFDTYYNTHYNLYTKPYEKIQDMLQFLQEHHIKLAVISNKPHEFVTKIVNEFFGDTFEVVLGHSDKNPKKPDPTSLLNTIQTYHVLPQECMFIGDSDVDIVTAKNAGVVSVGVSWGFRGKKELAAAKADFIIDDPERLLDVVESFLHQT
ncbi:MAG: hypothetical protein K0R90_1313 [Oscillospiraceae bacterium]|nr:hypothetical protein [Oscillospiraceae bacterium]